MRHTYKSKYNLNRENQVILLMITDGENNNGDFYFLNRFQSYITKNELKKHKIVCENYYYYYVEIPEEDNKILKYNHGEKSVRAPFVIYTDLESLLEKTNTCNNNPEKP